MWKVIVFVVQFLCLACSTTGASYHNQEPVSLCAGKEVTTKFVYGDSAVKLINLTVINWTVRKTKQDTAEIFCYYNNNNGFKIRHGQGDRFKDRVTWVNNTINQKFSNLTADDTGFYDVAITIFGVGKEETKDTNATFQLTVNDPCLIDEGKNEKGCSMLVCSSMEDNPVYSWTGQDAEGKTDRKLTVCPGIETNYTCCVDAQKTKCSSFTTQAGASYHNQEPVSLCAGKEVTTKFVYGNSAVKFINLTVINWTVRKTKQDTAEIFCYYNKATGFKIRGGQGDRFKDRVTWVPNTINLKFIYLTADDTGLYDVSITIFGTGKEETKDTNSTFQLTVNDPCLIDEGKNEKGCTMLECSSMEENQVYSWTGRGAKGNTASSLTVCPNDETNYTCCVDAEKTKCSSITAQAGTVTRMKRGIYSIYKNGPFKLPRKKLTTTTTPKTTQIVTTITTTKTTEKLTTFSPPETTVSTGNPNYVNQESVSLCAGKDVTTNFVYGDSAARVINMLVIQWSFKKTRQETEEIFSYYNRHGGFKVLDRGNRFKNRVTWVPDTINLKFSDLTTDDTGYYDVAITIFGAGKEETKDTNATFQLIVNDPCLMANVGDCGCTMLNCSSIEDNPVYSWTGKDVEGMTVSSLDVCPKEETNYSCCVDAQKTKCTSFKAHAACQHGFIRPKGTSCVPCGEQCYGQQCLQNCSCSIYQRCDHVHGCLNKTITEESIQTTITEIVTVTDLVWNTVKDNLTVYMTSNTVDTRKQNITPLKESTGLLQREIIIYSSVVAGILLALGLTILVRKYRKKSKDKDIMHEVSNVNQSNLLRQTRSASSLYAEIDEALLAENVDMRTWQAKKSPNSNVELKNNDNTSYLSPVHSEGDNSNILRSEKGVTRSYLSLHESDHNSDEFDKDYEASGYLHPYHSIDEDWKEKTHQYDVMHASRIEADDPSDSSTQMITDGYLNPYNSIDEDWKEKTHQYDVMHASRIEVDDPSDSSTQMITDGYLNPYQSLKHDWKKTTDSYEVPVTIHQCQGNSLSSLLHKEGLKGDINEDRKDNTQNIIGENSSDKNIPSTTITEASISCQSEIEKAVNVNNNSMLMPSKIEMKKFVASSEKSIDHSKQYGSQKDHELYQEDESNLRKNKNVPINCNSLEVQNVDVNASIPDEHTIYTQDYTDAKSQ